MRIKNWDKHQSYRKDRAAPPWIKLHRNIQDHYKWVGLTDAQRGQLISMWLLASENGGEIPNDVAEIERKCHMTTPLDLNVFKDFIVDAPVDVKRRQVTPGVPQRREEKRREEYLVDSCLIDAWKKYTGRKASRSRSLEKRIRSLKRQGFSIEDMELVLTYRLQKKFWNNPDMTLTKCLSPTSFDEELETARGYTFSDPDMQDMSAILDQEAKERENGNNDVGRWAKGEDESSDSPQDSSQDRLADDGRHDSRSSQREAVCGGGSAGVGQDQLWYEPDRWDFEDES